MKILLCGEYSGVHSALKKGLQRLGHEVILLSDGDAYKNINSDMRAPEIKLIKSHKILFSILDFLGVYGIWNFLRFVSLNRIGKFDVIQIINPVIVPSFGALGNALFFLYLRMKSKNIHLCALGDDRRWVLHCLRRQFNYSPLDRLSPRNAYRYYYSLKYVFSPAYVILDFIIRKSVRSVIAGLEDYFLAYKGRCKRLHLIRFPLVEGDFTVCPTIETKKKLKVIHAWQKGKELRKGNDILHMAMQEVVKRIGEDMIEYKVLSGVSYEEYVRSCQDCDVLLDQIYSQDCGMTAALGMASAKVVVSGLEGHEKYAEGLPDNVKKIGVNATPNIDDLIDCLYYVLTNKAVIDEIRINAFNFALRNYNMNKNTLKFIKVWAE